jgi:integrase
MNLSLGKVYLSHADPLAAKRDWQFAIDEFISQYKDSTRQRYEREFRSHAYNSILQKPMIQTTADDLRTVMKRGKKFTNRVLRILHNFALGNGWIHWHIINPKQWPDCPKMPKRAITQDEHQKIIAAEGNDERRFYYQMLWEIGAAQTDGALLTAENFDWNQRILSFQRQKTGQWCRLKISAELEGLAKKLPTNGLLFPKIARQQDKHRAAQFCRRLKQLKIHGISLHSYRYSWAERACAAGIAERFAQAALGHSSKAVHRAYAKKAYVVCPIIETPKDKVIPLVQPRIENQPTGEEIKTG